MKALTWDGVNELVVRDVPEPRIEDAGDVLVKVTRTVTCGSDLHLLGGYIPFTAKGDVLAHEFLGEVVEVGPGVQRHRVGDRVVVASFIRLAAAREHIGCETLDDEIDDIPAELRERSGGRGPDVCIQAVGMEAHGRGPAHVYDQVKQQLRLQTGRPGALREAIFHCRKGGSVFVLGVFAGFVDSFPMGAVVNKALTLRGAQQHGQRYIPMLLERMARDEIVTEHFATHTMPLAEGPRGYEMFKEKLDGNIRTVFLSHG